MSVPGDVLQMDLEEFDDLEPQQDQEPEGMAEDELIAALEHELDNALGGDSGELADVRGKAWEYFLGLPFGSEKDGRSSVVSTDLAEVIDWVMPEVLRAFAAGDQGVEFAALGKEDEDQADQESKAVNHIFFRRNNGLLVLHNWFQEAFLSKTGYVKAYWDDTPKYETREIDDLTAEDLLILEEDDDIELIEAVELPQTQAVQITGEGEMPYPGEPRYRAKIKIIASPGRLVVKPLPGFETRVNSDHTEVSLQEARFAAHTRLVTRSELIEMGYDRELVMGLPTDEERPDNSEEEARETVTDETFPDDQPQDPASHKVEFTEAYWNVDADGDGIAERRFIHYAGGELLSDEEVERVQIIALSPFPLANKHLGRSFYDKVKEIQETKSQLKRQIVENIYLHNNGRYGVLENKVNLRELVQARAGGYFRQKVAGAVEPLPVIPFSQDIYTFLDREDKEKERRTGVGPETVSELGQLANSTAWGVERLMAKKEELVGLIIAIFRNTGVNELFEVMHAILRENQQPMTLPLDDDWPEVNPQEWPARTAVPTVTWSGMGDKISTQKNLMHVMQYQDKVLQGPNAWMVQPEHQFEVLDEFLQAAGLRTTGKYMVNPSMPEAEQYQQKAQQQAQQAMQMQQMQNQQATQALAQVEQIKAEAAREIAALKEANKRDLDRMKAVQDQQNMQVQMDYKYAELEQRLVEKLSALEAQMQKDIPGGIAIGN